MECFVCLVVGKVNISPCFLLHCSLQQLFRREGLLLLLRCLMAMRLVVAAAQVEGFEELPLRTTTTTLLHRLRPLRLLLWRWPRWSLWNKKGSSVARPLVLALFGRIARPPAGRTREPRPVSPVVRSEPRVVVLRNRKKNSFLHCSR